MAGEKILLPFKFTDYDQRALDFVIRHFAHLKDAEITLFHAYTPAPEIESRDSPVMDRLRESLNYLAQRIQDQEAGLTAAGERLLENGFSEDQVRYVFKAKKKEIACEIRDLASDGCFDLVVINHKPGKVTRFFTGSVFNKVVNNLKETTVFIKT